MRIGHMILPRAILVAVNFSATSRMALVLAARLALLCAAELHVLHAEDPLLSAAADRAGIDLVREKHEEWSGSSPTPGRRPKLAAITCRGGSRLLM